MPPATEVESDSLLPEERVTLDVWHWQDPMLQTVQLRNAEDERKRAYTAVVHLDRGAVVQLAMPDQPEVEVGREGDGQADRERRADLLKGLMLVIGGLTALGIGGGVTVAMVKGAERRRKALQDKVDVVKAPLLEMESPFQVTPKNVWTRDTLAALLDDETNSRGEAASPATLLPALGMELVELTRKVKATEGKDDDEALVTLMVQEGLNHPVPEVREYIVEALTSPDLDPNGGLNRADDYEPFMELLKSEQDVEVIQALSRVMLEMTTADDVAELAAAAHTLTLTGANLGADLAVARVRGAEAGVCAEVGPLNGFEQRLPLRVGVGRKEDPSLLRLIEAAQRVHAVQAGVQDGALGLALVASLAVLSGPATTFRRETRDDRERGSPRRG